jgi:hypothetical protein
LDDVPVTALTYADVTCKVLKAGVVAWAAKALVNPAPPGVTNFAEVGEGFYRILMTAAELNTLGIFRYKLIGAAIDECDSWVMVVAAALVSDAYSLDTCDITGRFVGPDGQPLADALVYWLALGASAHLGALVSRTTQSVKTRSDGTFTLTIPRSLFVSIDCPAADYSRRLTVPNQASKDLLEIS